MLDTLREPIIRYWPDTQGGQELDQTVHAQTANEINIKHGYQLGADVIGWVLGLFVSGDTHDPTDTFQDSRNAFNAGNYPLIALYDSYFFGNGHVVRPYKWDDSDPNNWVIYVANPNNPAAMDGDGDDPCIITIDPNGNVFTFKFDSSDTYTGSTWNGGRMYYIPFSLVSGVPVTPFEAVLQLIEDGIIIFLGSSGQTQQITDGNGKTLYQTGLGGVPTRWDQMVQDPTQRVPNLTRVPLTDGGTGTMPIEMHYGRGAGVTLAHEIVPASGVPAGTPYEYTLHTPTLSAYLSIPGTPGTADVLTASLLHTPDKSFMVTAAAAKSITWTMAGGIKQRWFQLDSLGLAAGQAMTARLSNSGYEFTLHNSGPATTANLTVKAGPGATPVVVGQITIGPGDNGPFTFDAPKTALTTNPSAPNGKAGWFISPVIITLTAYDYSSTGIKYIEYSKDGLVWIIYTGPFVYGGPTDYADEGATTLYYRATDNALDQEPPEHSALKVDTRAPVITATLPPTITRVQPLTISFSAADPTPGSGLDAGSVAGVFNGGTFQNQPVTNGQVIALFWQPLGTYTLSVTASDVAGNVGSGSASTALVATLASLAAEIVRLRQLGEIDSDGIENSFLSQVAAATADFNAGKLAPARLVLGALLNAIAAQRGVHITARAADLLSGDVSYVQTHLA